MYPAYQAHVDLLWPLRAATRWSLPLLQDPSIADNHWLPARQMAAAGQVFELAQVTHKRPPLAHRPKSSPAAASAGRWSRKPC